MKKFARLLAVATYVFAAQIYVSGLSGHLAVPAFAQAECSAGFYPKTTTIVQNGNFATAPTDITPAGDPGDNNANPGFFYSNASFYSQMANAGTDVYATASSSYNAFSVQTGNFFDNSISDLDQVVFPGDPAYNIAGSNTWLYTNGNAFNGGEYLNWEQDVSGLTNGADYVFTAYISSVLEPTTPDVDDPTMRLKIGGASGLPNGTTIVGPIVLTEAATSNASPLNGWQRVAFKFTASGTTEKLKITDASTGIFGDDFALTAIGLQVCTPVPDYTIALAHSGSPAVGSSFTETVTVNNIGTGAAESADSITINLPAGYKVNGGAAGALTLTNNASSYSCTSNALNPQSIQCSSSTPVPVSGSQSFQFSTAVNGSAAASSSITASVSVPFEDVTGNNNATDPVAVAPDIKNTLSVLSSTATSAVVQTKVENIGTGYTTGPVTLTQTLPAGITVNNGSAGPVTLGGQNAADWTCTSDAASPQIVTCTHSNTMQNNTSTDQIFTMSMVLGANVTNINIQSTASTSGDTNASNDQSSTSITPGSGSANNGNLSNTGSTTRMPLTIAIASVCTTVVLIYATRKRYHKYSIRS